jgi:cytochrome c oxidase accessory protein FixG
MRRNSGPFSIDKLWRKTLKHALYIVLSFLVAHIMLAYFVSLPRLYKMVLNRPSDHPEAFAWAACLTSVFYFNFFWFREQLCLIVCPYGRLQSVLTDHATLIIGYDVARGEPRGKAGALGAGACVDCKRCVVVCPTGIDIRNGLQIDCIGCARCIDACDEVMDKLERSRGLVRYDSQNGLSGLPRRVLRPRVYLYAALGFLGAVALSIALTHSEPFAANVLRLRDAPPFTVEHGRVRNSFEVHLVNKRAQDMTFMVRGINHSALTYVIAIPRITLSALAGQRIPIFVEFPLGTVHDGDKARIEISADHAPTRVVEAPLLAPDGH